VLVMLVHVGSSRVMSDGDTSAAALCEAIDLYRSLAWTLLKAFRVVCGADCFVILSPSEMRLCLMALD